jgi:hypothetical protein
MMYNTNPVQPLQCRTCHARFVPESSRQAQCHGCQIMEATINKYKKRARR